jgi:hypothetical protein
MQRSKVLALIALVGMLIVGGAAGFTADRTFFRGACRDPNDRQSLREYLAERLDLTATQQAAVDSILDKRHRDMSAVFAPVRPKLDSIRIAARVEISKLLDARQQRRFQQMIEESKREDSTEHR